MQSLPVAQEPDAGNVVSYTVLYHKDKAPLAVVLGDTDGAERFLARSADADTVAAIEARSPIGLRIAVHTEEDRHYFTLA